MRLTEVPAKAGYVWFRQGVWLFRRNPLAFLTIFFTYIFSMMLLSLIPVLGDFLPLLLVPGASVGFMTACREAAAGKPVSPAALIAGFTANGRPAARRLLRLGAAYVLAIALVFASSALADGGALLKMMLLGAPLNPAALNPELLLAAMMVALTAYIPVAMLFWFAPVLTVWHDLPLRKALFFSWMACWRNRGAMSIYGLCWLALGMSVSLGLTALLRVLGLGAMAVTLLMPVSVVVTTIMYCSFYATYRGCFAAEPEEPELLPG